MAEDEQEQKPIKIDPEPAVFSEGYQFPDEVLKRWIDIPNDELITVGPIPKLQLDQLLFSTKDLTRAILALRGAFILWSQGNIEQANICLDNCMNAANDADTRNRLLYDAIMRSSLGVKDGNK